MTDIKTDGSVSYNNKIVGSDATILLANKGDRSAVSFGLSFASRNGSSSPDPCFIITDDSLPAVNIDISYTTGISFDISTTYDPQINLHHTQGNIFKCAYNRQRNTGQFDGKMMRALATATLIDTCFQKAVIHYSGYKWEIYSGSFGTLDVHSETSFKMAGTICDELSLSVLPKSTAMINNCTFLSSGLIYGKMHELTIKNTDLSKVEVNVAAANVNLSRCIGNDATIRHMSIGDLFINWTATDVYINSGDISYPSIRVYNITTLAEFITRIGYADWSGLIVDTILDSPAEPMTGE